MNVLSGDVLLSTWASVLQLTPAVVLVGLVLRREVSAVLGRAEPRVERTITLLTPVVLVVLVARFLVILA